MKDFCQAKGLMHSEDATLGIVSSLWLQLQYYLLLPLLVCSKSWFPCFLTQLEAPKNISMALERRHSACPRVLRTSLNLDTWKKWCSLPGAESVLHLHMVILSITTMKYPLKPWPISTSKLLLLVVGLMLLSCWLQEDYKVRMRLIAMRFIIFRHIYKF